MDSTPNAPSEERVRKPYAPTIPATDVGTLPLMLKIPQAAALANKSERGILLDIHAGIIHAVKLGSSWRIPRDAYLELLGLQ